MSIYKRIRDSLTGRFTTNTHPAITVAESPAPGINRINRRILANAISEEKMQVSCHTANKVMRDAILKVLETPTR